MHGARCSDLMRAKSPVLPLGSLHPALLAIRFDSGLLGKDAGGHLTHACTHACDCMKNQGEQHLTALPRPSLSLQGIQIFAHREETALVGRKAMRGAGLGDSPLGFSLFPRRHPHPIACIQTCTLTHAWEHTHIHLAAVLMYWKADPRYGPITRKGTSDMGIPRSRHSAETTSRFTGWHQGRRFHRELSCSEQA